MNRIIFQRSLIAAALACSFLSALAQHDRHDRDNGHDRSSYQYGHVAHYNWGESDDKPRFEDGDGIYLWHEGHTFYIAVGAEQRGSIFVRADVERGSIGDVSHRRMDEFRNGNRQWEARRFDRGWDNQGVNHPSPDIIEYSTRPGSWDIIRFDIRGGESVRFNFDPSRNEHHSRTIHIGGEHNRQTHSETVQIELRH